MGGRLLGRQRLARPHAGHVAAALLAVACAACADGATRRPDVPFEPTPPPVVEAMLDLAGVTAGDTVYDLGCGDGRIVVAAAKRGARAVGVDIDPRRIRESRERARSEGVEDRVELRQGDLFETDVSPADVVTLFLWPHVNLRLRPRLLAQLRPGARVVSYMHDMGDWPPQRTVPVPGGRNLYLWIVPERRGSAP
jgi:SAM-dependent methyltransferase